MRQWNLGIDMGSTMLRCVTGDGAFTAQSSAVSMRTGEALAFGEEALRLWERGAFGVETGFPYRNGALANEKYFSLWVRDLLNLVPRGKARVLFACPFSMSSYEKKHTAALIMQSGAADCGFVSSEMASLWGASEYHEECAVLCDVGAGHISCAAIAGDSMLRSESIPYGMSEADHAIVRLCEEKHHMTISLAQAEEIKKTLSSLKGLSMSFKGLSLVSGFPCECEIASEDAAQSVSPYVQQAVRLVRSVIASLSPECLEDLSETGILLTGGGARAAHLEELLKGASHLDVQTASDCENACVRGLEKIMHSEALEGSVSDYAEIMQAK